MNNRFQLFSLENNVVEIHLKHPLLLLAFLDIYNNFAAIMVYIIYLVSYVLELKSIVTLIPQFEYLDLRYISDMRNRVVIYYFNRSCFEYTRKILLMD